MIDKFGIDDGEDEHEESCISGKSDK